MQFYDQYAVNLWRLWNIETLKCNAIFYLILCGWSGRPGQSPTAHSFGTYIINVQKHAQDICSLVPTSLTNCFAEYEQRTLYGAFVVAPAMLLRLTYWILCVIVIFFINVAILLYVRLSHENDYLLTYLLINCRSIIAIIIYSRVSVRAAQV